MRHAGADAWAGCPSRRVARWFSRAGHAAYWYKWSYAPEGPNGEYPKLAHHACEQPFVFHVLNETEEESKEDKGVYHIEPNEADFSSKIVSLWLSMARQGAPVADGVLAWPRYSATRQECMMIGAPPRPGSLHNTTFWVQPAQSQDKCSFWDAVFEAQGGPA